SLTAQHHLPDRSRSPKRLITIAEIRTEAQLAFVRAGLGVAQLATWLVRDDLKAGRLVAILDEAATDGLPLSLIWPVARQLTPKIHVLVQKLEAHLHTG
ncbi:LysR substrate-binding domain-containing protein, partial [Burkholderia multivorans]|uniref:LysR substrate-binding domain-containing protein n=1 Tax=Burkholderia multivorans TaxID=87883 RepID=UPI002158F14F